MQSYGVKKEQSDTSEQPTLLFSLTNNKTESLLIQLIILWSWNMNSLLPDSMFYPLITVLHYAFETKQTSFRSHSYNQPSIYGLF